VRSDDDGRITEKFIGIADDLDRDGKISALSHETGHAIDMGTAPPATREEFRSMRWGIPAAEADEAVEDSLPASLVSPPSLRAGGEAIQPMRLGPGLLQRLCRLAMTKG
jgi:hypothetical protein